MGTTYFVDGGCPSSGTGLSLTCGPSGPFRTIGECIVAMNPALADGCDIRGGHAAESAHGTRVFDGFYFEPVWMDDAPPLGLRGQALDCAPGRCIIEGCRAAHGCPVDERPTARGMTRRTWTSLGGGIWSRIMEATPEPGRSGINTNRTGTAGDYDPYELFEDDGTGPYNLAYAGDNVATPADGQWSFNPTTRVVSVNPTGNADPNAAVWVPHFSDLAWATSPSSNVTLQYMDFIGSRTVGLDLGTPPAGSLPGFELHHIGVGHLRRMGIHCQSASGIVFDDVHLFNLGRGESYQGAGADSTYGIRCFHIDGFTMQDVLVEGVANAGQVNLSHTPPDSPGHPCSWCTPPWNDPAHTWASNQSNAVQIKQTAGGTMTRVHVRDNQGAAISIDCSRNIAVTASDATDTGSCVDAWSFTQDTNFNWWSGLSIDGFTCRNAGIDDVQHCAMNLLGGNATERDAGSLPYLVHVTNTFMNGVGFAGICLDTGPNQTTTPSDVVFAYNSIQGARVTGDADNGARGIVVNTASSNVLIENNAVAGIPNEQMIVTAGASGVTSDYDLFDATTAGSCPLRWGGPIINPGPSPSGGTCGTVAAYRTATGNERHGINGIVGFVSAIDDHLGLLSAGINAGICLPGITSIDHDGGARPVGATCDIGADEFGSLANP